MAGSVYSAQLAYGLNTTGGANTVYTCPAGYTAVLLDMELLTPGTGSTSTHLIRVNGSGYWYYMNATAQLQHAQWSGRLVLNADDEIQIQSTTQELYYFLSGWLLTN